MKPTWKRNGLTIAVLSFITGFSGQTAKAGLVITPFFDDSVTAAQQTVINNAISFYETSFINPIDVSIEFLTQGAGGSSGASLYYKSLADARTLLKNDSTANPQNRPLAQGLTQFGGGNSAQQMQINSADCRALGGDCPGTKDGIGSVAENELDGIVKI